MYAPLEYVGFANTWPTDLLKVIVLLEYIDLLVKEGCKIIGQPNA